MLEIMKESDNNTQSKCDPTMEHKGPQFFRRRFSEQQREMAIWVKSWMSWVGDDVGGILFVKTDAAMTDYERRRSHDH